MVKFTSDVREGTVREKLAIVEAGPPERGLMEIALWHRMFVEGLEARRCSIAAATGARFRIGIRLLAWVVLLAIFAATISPIDERPRLLADVSLERAGAYFVLGLLFCVGYRRHWLTVFSLVLLSAVGFEAAQLLVLGRHAHVIDAMEKVAGGAFGFGVGLFATAWRRLQPAR